MCVCVTLEKQNREIDNCRRKQDSSEMSRGYFIQVIQDILTVRNICRTVTTVTDRFFMFII